MKIHYVYIICMYLQKVHVIKKDTLIKHVFTVPVRWWLYKYVWYLYVLTCTNLSVIIWCNNAWRFVAELRSFELPDSYWLSNHLNDISNTLKTSAEGSPVVPGSSSSSSDLCCLFLNIFICHHLKAVIIGIVEWPATWKCYMLLCFVLCLLV